MPRRVASFATLALAVTLASPVAAQDTGPVTKPLPSPAGGNRLPAPTGLSVRQDAQGAIVFSWSAVPGAVRYNLGRSVGTDGFRQAMPPSTESTSLLDTRVTVGIRHVYTVTPIDAQGVAGVRATSEVFTPTRPYAAGAPSSPANVVARVSGNAVSLSWSGGAPDAVLRYRVRRNGIPLASSPALPMLSDAGLAPGQYQYDVAAEDRAGNLSPWAKSNLVTIEGATSGGSTSGSTGGGTTAGGISAEDAGGAVLVNVAAPVTLRVGATQSLASIARGGWTSLSPAIASVSADGTVSARAAGVAQLAAVGADAGGAVRVTVVRVRVTP